MRTTCKVSMLLALVYSMAYCIDLDGIAVKMRRGNNVAYFGEDAQLGKYLVYLYDYIILPDEGRELSLEKAKLEAKNSLAGYFSTVSSGEVKTKMKVTTTIAGGKENTQMNDDYQELIRNSNRHNFSGLTQKTVVKTEEIEVVSLISQKVQSKAAELEAAIKKQETPDTVVAIGQSVIGAGGKGEAEKIALREAHRNAIAMVLGEHIVSSSEKMTVAKSVAHDGQEAALFKDSFRAKVYSSAEGFIEQSRILKREVTGNVLTLEVACKVSRKSVIDDYRACVKAIGNPGFLVRSNDEACLDAISGFLATLGLNVVEERSKGDYWVNVRLNFRPGNSGGKKVMRGNISIEVMVPATRSKAFSLVTPTGEAYYEEGDEEQAKSSLGVALLEADKARLHNYLNRYLGRINADGREVNVQMFSYDSRYRNEVKQIKACLEGIPGVGEVEMDVDDDVVVYRFQYPGDTKRLQQLLDAQMEVNIAKKKKIPKIDKRSVNKLEYIFE